jgi:hypothetical protein
MKIELTFWEPRLCTCLPSHFCTVTQFKCLSVKDLEQVCPAALSDTLVWNADSIGFIEGKGDKRDLATKQVWSCGDSSPRRASFVTESRDETINILLVFCGLSSMFLFSTSSVATLLQQLQRGTQLVACSSHTFYHRRASSPWESPLKGPTGVIQNGQQVSYGFLPLWLHMARASLAVVYLCIGLFWPMFVSVGIIVAPTIIMWIKRHSRLTSQMWVHRSFH